MQDPKLLSEISSLLQEQEYNIVKFWMEQLDVNSKKITATLGSEEVKRFTTGALSELIRAISTSDNIDTEPYRNMRQLLEKLTADMAFKGMSPSETATLVFSLKEALVGSLQQQYPDKARFNDIIVTINRIVDKLGLFTFETFTRTRERLIHDQQKALSETSAPVVKIWDKILMIPLVGVLDSARTQLVMETLLTAIEETQSKVIILDISGIPIVDSLVAKHLIRTVSAAKLMGSECIITGIRARISYTIVQLGVDLTGIITKTTLADGLRVALDLLQLKVAPK